jgi:hypothetical protein
MDPAVPFGGYKMSGYGRESGKQQVEEYLNVKAVWIKTAWRHPASHRCIKTPRSTRRLFLGGNSGARYSGTVRLPPFRKTTA